MEIVTLRDSDAVVRTQSGGLKATEVSLYPGALAPVVNVWPGSPVPNSPDYRYSNRDHREKFGRRRAKLENVVRSRSWVRGAQVNKSLGAACPRYNNEDTRRQRHFRPKTGDDFFNRKRCFPSAE